MSLLSINKSKRRSKRGWVSFAAIQGHRVTGSLPDIEEARVRVANVSYPTTGIAQFFRISNVGRVDPACFATLTYSLTLDVSAGRVHIRSHADTSRTEERVSASIRSGADSHTYRSGNLYPWGHTQIRHGYRDSRSIGSAELVAISVPDFAEWLFLAGLLAAGGIHTPV